MRAEHAEARPKPTRSLPLSLHQSVATVPSPINVATGSRKRGDRVGEAGTRDGASLLRGRDRPDKTTDATSRPPFWLDYASGTERMAMTPEQREKGSIVAPGRNQSPGLAVKIGRQCQLAYSTLVPVCLPAMKGLCQRLMPL